MGGIPVAAVVALAVVYVAGILLKKTEVFPTLVLTGIWASAAIGLGVLVGRTGQLSLGQGALSAVAAYASGYFSARHGFDFAEAVLMGLAAALLISLVTSPILRVRGFYFALATLALAVVVDELLVAWQGLTGGANGLNGIHALTAFGRRITSETAFFNIGWFTAVMAAAVIAVFFRSRYGRALKALTVDEDLAASLGVPCARYKMGIWLLSGLLAGIAGVLYAYYNVFLTPDEFGIDRSITLIAAVVVGGAATVLGPIVGLIGVMVVPQLLNIGQGGTTAVTAVVLVVTAVVMPDGLVPEGGRVLRLLRSRLRPAAVPTPDPEVSGAEVEDRPVPAPTEEAIAESAAPREPAPPDGTALEIKGLCKRFGGLSVLNGVNLSVEPGHIHGLIGPNGAGKTSLINCITGLLEPDEGDVRLFGEDVTRARTDVLCRAGLVRTFQHTRLLPEESVLENVVVGAHTLGDSGVVSAVVRTAGIRREERDLYRRAEAALESMGCATLAQEKAANLTAGQQRLVQVARGLVAGPRVLLLDEPAAGLNETEVARLGGYLDDLRRLGTTIVLVEHHLDLIMTVCDRISVLSGGVIIADGAPESIRRNELVIDAYLGAAS